MSQYVCIYAPWWLSVDKGAASCTERARNGEIVRVLAYVYPSRSYIPQTAHICKKCWRSHFIWKVQCNLSFTRSLNQADHVLQVTFIVQGNRHIKLNMDTDLSNVYNFYLKHFTTGEYLLKNKEKIFFGWAPTYVACVAGLGFPKLYLSIDQD
jgi:hypothetical protein